MDERPAFTTQCHCCMGMTMVISIPKTFVLVCNLAVSILLAEYGLMCLPDQWHSAQPPSGMRLQPCHLALYTSRWLWNCLGPLVCRAQSGQQGMICVSGRMTWITLTSRSCLPTSGSAGMLSGITWTFALGPVLLRTHACAHTRTGLLGLQVAMLGHFWTCPFPCAACSACCASEWAATSCPGTLDAGFVCQD